MKRILIDLDDKEYQSLIKIKGEKTWKELLLEVLYLNPETVAEFERKKKIEELNKKISVCFAELRQDVLYTELLDLIEVLLKSLVENSNKEMLKQIALKILNYIEEL